MPRDVNQPPERPTLATVPRTAPYLSPPLPEPSPKSSSSDINASRKLKPDEYSWAVLQYSRLPTGAGQNFKNIGAFLRKGGPTTVQIEPRDQKLNSGFVTLYKLKPDIQGRRPSLQEPDSGDDRSQERSRTTSSEDFADAFEFYNRDDEMVDEPCSHMIFLRGFMSANWLNSIGGKYLVDPEFFCRHIDFQNPEDAENTFSNPPLPSASWHLIQLPIMTVGTRNKNKGSISIKDLERLRCEGSEKLSVHHKPFSNLSQSSVTVGESMVRDYIVFDETHFAIEQRISICLKEKDQNTYNLFIWLDNGKPFQKDHNEFPWIPGTGDCFLPVIRPKNGIALKSHLIDQSSDPNLQSLPSAFSVHRNYGRSLRPSVMCTDAFYALNELFSFAASSEMAFVNLLEHMLDKYTEPSKAEFEALPNLRYMKGVLYRHAQKIAHVLDSIRNTEHPRWPKAKTSEGIRKAGVASSGLKQDFQHLQERVQVLQVRCNEAITVLMSSMSIAESKKAIDQAERVSKLTFLAFIFVPLSFTTSFFGMNVKELSGSPSLWWWAVFTVPIVGFAFVGFFLDWSRAYAVFLRSIRRVWDTI